MGRKRCKMGLKKILLKDLNFFKDSYVEIEDCKVKAIIEHVNKYGQYAPLYVRKLENGFELLQDKIFFNVVKDYLDKRGQQEVIAFDYGNINDKEAELIYIYHNELKFVSDIIELSKLLQVFDCNESEEEMFKHLPFTYNDILDLKKLIEFDWTKVKVDSEEQENKIESMTFEI
jgi:hypothetical protein